MKKNRIILTSITNSRKLVPAAFMLSGAFLDILHIQDSSLFDAINAFMLCTMMLVNSSDIFHQRSKIHTKRKMISRISPSNNASNVSLATTFVRKPARKYRRHKQCNRDHKR